MRQTERGFSALELLVTVGIIGALMAFAISNIKSQDSPLENGTAQLSSFFKKVRARAVSSTLAYTVYPISETQVRTEYAFNCEETNTAEDTRLTLDLPNPGVYMNETAWSVCFSPRGLADQSISITLVGRDYAMKQIEVLMGGSVREKNL